MSVYDVPTSFYRPEDEALDVGRSGPGPWDTIVAQEPPPPQPSAEPYSQENSHAIPVNQRSAKRWSGQTLTVDGTDIRELLPPQKGRKAFLVNVPNNAAAAVYIGASAANMGSGAQGFLLPIGSSLSLDTEGGVFAVSATAGTDTTVCIAVTWG